MKPLVIRASAGTGKTYRLSLEFINLLLKYRINFDEILVITFTKKAMAEIRERIFLQLYEIVNNTAAGIELKQSIQENINPEIQFNDDEMTFLKITYQKMITNKSAVKISTIDSFVNAIFSGIIAPFHNITDFQIDNKINTEILPEIYEKILANENLQNYENIFLQAKRRNLDQFQQLITGIIENRWIFEFIDHSDFENLDIEVEREKALKNYQSELKIFLDLLQSEIVNNPKPTILENYFQTDFRKILLTSINFNELKTNQVAMSLYEVFTNIEFLLKNYKLIFDKKKKLYLGSKLKNDELKVLYSCIQENLANFLYYDKALTEQLNIISLAGEVSQVYDEIKFRDKIFTHSDISYFTFRFLYDPQLSIIDKGNVLNIFYEQLSYNTRFVLIDEFQDTSILQWSIFHPMLKEITSGIGQKDYGNVIVVGDEKQAIYGWRGGERKLLTDFESILNEPVDYDTLSTSYRSKPVLMNWLNKLFKSDFLTFVDDWDYTEIDCAKTEGGFVQIDFRNGIEGDSKLDKAEIYREFVKNNLQLHLENGKLNPADTAIIMRKNKELEIMAQVLDEVGIDYTLEMSGSLFQHKAIKPIVFILKFLVYEDFMELIKFLRSDLVLMNPADLKIVIEEFKNSQTLNDFLQNCVLHPYFHILFKLKHHSSSLLILIKSILEEFGFSSVFSSEIELKNLQRFLEVAAEFERSNHEFTTNVSGFLRYCKFLEEKDEYSQIGQSISNSIKLLTIHKSKGLQFETVFAVFDVSGKSGGNNSGLKLYYKFADNFRSLDDFAFTFNYNKIMQKSKKSGLIDYIQKRDSGDELNNIYVALTRAKNNLFIYLHYNKKGNLQKFINDIKADATVLKQVTNTIYQEFSDNLQKLSEVHHHTQFGEISTDPTKEEIVTSKKLELPDYFDIVERENIRKQATPNLHKLKTEFLQNQSKLLGNIVHEFLSHIKYSSENEIKLAANKTIAKYGSLLHISILENILKQVRNFINENSEYFDEAKWDQVFNEYVLFDEFGKESRIDRLMINTEKKEILIVDFKTGSHSEEEQLEKYKKVIGSLPIVRKNQYNIETKFVEIKLSSS
jgi:ATP-dependent exoDNAse (exonuclease V) beta subunit